MYVRDVFSGASQSTCIPIPTYFHDLPFSISSRSSLTTVNNEMFEEESARNPISVDAENAFCYTHAKKSMDTQYNFTNIYFRTSFSYNKHERQIT